MATSLARKLLILKGEMAERSMAHAWKTIPATLCVRLRNVPRPLSDVSSMAFTSRARPILSVKKHARPIDCRRLLAAREKTNAIAAGGD